jgi:protease I
MLNKSMKEEGAMKLLEGKKIAILAENFYEDMELWFPRLRFRGLGAEVVVVGSGSADTYTGKHGYPVTVDKAASDVNAADFDAVIIPGGYAPDHMRRHPEMIDLVRQAYEHGKVVAAICHGPWMLISAHILKAKTVTAFFAIKDDLVNAGATYVDQEVMVDGTIITSRKPNDLPAFCDAIMMALVGEAVCPQCQAKLSGQ